MHYVVFLMHHGFRPYAQITDNNMPGAYITEAAAMRLFGPGDLAWRIYEFVLLGLSFAALVLLSRQVDAVAGVFAGVLFVMMHATEGPQFAAERELVIAVLLLWAVLFYEWALQRERPVWAGASALCLSWAASIKPTCLLFLLLLSGLGMATLPRQRRAIKAYVPWWLAGAFLPGVICILFLHHYQAFSDFGFIVKTIIPAYAGTAPLSLPALLWGALPRAFRVLLLAVLPLSLARRLKDSKLLWQHLPLLAGALFGLASYLIQRKGFPHHRYTFLLFLVLIASLELFAALQSTGLLQWWAAAVILLMLVAFVPKSLQAAAAVPPQTDLYLSLQHDVQTLQMSASLNRNVFCLDLVYGCLNVLYHEGLIESAPFTGDLLLFTRNSGPASVYYRDVLSRELEQHPPELFVLTNENLLGTQGFSRLGNWPALEAYLGARYILVCERRFTHEKYGIHYPVVLPPKNRMPTDCMCGRTRCFSEAKINPGAPTLAVVVQGR